MKLTLIDNHLSVFLFSFICFSVQCCVSVNKKYHFTCDLITLTCQIHLFFARSFGRRFLAPPPIEKINILKSSVILLFNFSSSLSIISSIHFHFFPLLILLVYLKLNICFILLFCILQYTFFEQGNLLLLN